MAAVNYQIDVRAKPYIVDGIELYSWEVFEIDEYTQWQGIGQGWEGSAEKAFLAAHEYCKMYDCIMYGDKDE